MAKNSLFDKMKSGTDNAMNALKEKTAPKSGNSGKASLLETKKEIKALAEKKAKLYSYIGMEIYDLHMAGQLEVPQTQEYCSQMDEISERIKSLEADIERLQAQNQRNNVCECGSKIGKNTKFCPSCGKPAQPDMIACTCGKLISSSTAFCEHCGAKAAVVQPAAALPSGQGIACICGASIPLGQPICMECGRRTQQ